MTLEGGSYILPLKVLEAQQEVAVDIRQLRDAQVKDSIGRVIALEATHGQARWSERGRALIGRLEVFSVSKGTCSSFVAGRVALRTRNQSTVSPDSFTSTVGDGGVAQAYHGSRHHRCRHHQFRETRLFGNLLHGRYAR